MRQEKREEKKIREEKKGQRIQASLVNVSSSLLLHISLSLSFSFFLSNPSLRLEFLATKSLSNSPMARSAVPKFGNWEGEENVPYTAYFEKARKVRASGGNITNPNDPEYNSDSQSQAPPPPSRTKPEHVDPVRRSREQMRSRDESELKQYGDGGGGSSNEVASKRQGRVSQNNSYDNKSPLHKNSYDGTGRTKPKPNLRADESPDKVTAVPKFGDWDENNPSSADGYTHIFNKVREERSSGANVTGSSRTPTHPNTRNNPSNASKCCCFGFGGK